LDGEFVNMACLPDEEAPAPIGEKCFVGGWGLVKDSGDAADLSGTLQGSVENIILWNPKFDYTSFWVRKLIFTLQPRNPRV